MGSMIDFSPPVGDEVAPFSVARRSAKLATNAITAPPHSGAAELRWGVIKSMVVVHCRCVVVISSHKLRTATSAPTPCTGALVGPPAGISNAFVLRPGTEQTQHRSGTGRFLC